LPGAVAQLQHQITVAGQAKVTPTRYLRAPDQIAHSHYMQRLGFDDELRNDYQPYRDDHGRIRETAHMTAAKQWMPITGAFTGTRVSEITQLHKEDIW
jgi:hypothetical protein